jgi:hypothetical protein
MALPSQSERCCKIANIQFDAFGRVSDQFEVLTYLGGGPVLTARVPGNRPEQHTQTNCYLDSRNPEGKPGWESTRTEEQDSNITMVVTVHLDWVCAT